MFLPRALYWGHEAARDNYALQLRNIVHSAYANLGEKPVMIGESGIPMDLKWVDVVNARCETLSTYCSKGAAFVDGNWEWQEKMMDALVTGLDRSLVGFKYVVAETSGP